MGSAFCSLVQNSLTSAVCLCDLCTCSERFSTGHCVCRCWTDAKWVGQKVWGLVCVILLSHAADTAEIQPFCMPELETTFVRNPAVLPACLFCLRLLSFKQPVDSLHRRWIITLLFSTCLYAHTDRLQPSPCRSLLHVSPPCEYAKCLL